MIHQLPPKPTNLRVRIWRKLQKLGAVAIKNSVYVLPATEKAHDNSFLQLAHGRSSQLLGLGSHAQRADGLSAVGTDMYEHAYHMDYGAAAAKYVDAFMQNVNWDEVNRRVEAAGGRK